MLQQTQVERVISYYQRFIQTFPDPTSLSKSRLEAVLALWQGLGYNRRAKYLRDSAKKVVDEYGGKFPVEMDSLRSLPGIGHNTAAAIRVYSTNRPELFIETNIRTVFIYHFFKDVPVVDDQLILKILSQTLDGDNPREFYWALMDYGTYLKKFNRGINTQSTLYRRQSAFEGSNRQLRAKVLRYVSQNKADTEILVREFNDSRLTKVLNDLEKEGFIATEKGIYRIAD